MPEPEPTALIAAPDETAPEEDGPKRQDLSAEEALALLREGKVVSNARIRRLKFVGVIDHPVQFKGCLLVQPEFRGATFRETASFMACTLDRAQFHRKTVFEKDWRLDGSVLNKVIVNAVTVAGQLSAVHTEYRGKAVFRGCTFTGKVHFWEAKFLAWVEFAGCEFLGEADFRSLHAQEGFVLSKSKFHGDFLFRGSNVEKKFAADGCRFERQVDLSKAKFQDFAYLEAIDAGPGQTFAFLNTLGERIRVQPHQVEGRLASEREGRHEDAMQEYGLLKKCYSTLHRFVQGRRQERGRDLRWATLKR